MKKYLNWMFAAILICGATLVIASCGKDDDEEQTPQEEQKTNVYEVTLTVILPKSVAAYQYVEVQYTDAEGKTNTATVKEGDLSETMPASVKTAVNEAKERQKVLLEPSDVASLDKLTSEVIVKNFKMTAQAGKTISYKGSVAVKENYTIPTGETFDYLRPIVYPTIVRVSGNSTGYSEFNERLSFYTAFGVETDHFAEFLELQGNMTIGSASMTLE